MKRYTDDELNKILIGIQSDIEFGSDYRAARATAKSNVVIIELLIRLLEK